MKGVAMSYSKERRLEVLSAADEGLTTSEIALRYSCSQSWVRRVKQEYREQGKTEPATTQNRIPEWAAYADQIQKEIAECPDLTLSELKQNIKTDLSRRTLCTALRKLKLTLKKSPDRCGTGSP